MQTGYEVRGKNPGDRTVFWIDGERYELPGLDFTNGPDFETIEAYYRVGMKTPVAAVQDTLDELSKSPALKDEIISKLFQEIQKGNQIRGIPRQVIGTWLDSMEGAAFSLHLQLSKLYPDKFAPWPSPSFNLTRVRDIIRKLGIMEVKRLGGKEEDAEQLGTARALDLRDQASEGTVSGGK